MSASDSSEAAPAPSATGAALGGGPGDADQLRGGYFRQLLRQPLIQALLAGGALVIGAAVALATVPALGLIAALATLAAGLWIVFKTADRRAADAFFAAYAARRDLVLGGREPLPPATPLLRKGDDRYAERTLTGVLGERVGGVLALYTYEEETTDSDGSRQTNYYRYTIGLVEVPECAGHVPELYCQRKFGLKALEKLEDVFRRSKERLQLESAALDERYEIFAGKGQDAVWLRRLFSPGFIVWLSESAPEKFAFELVGGTLCCYVKDHQEDAAALDAVALATATVARRLRDESLE